MVKKHRKENEEKETVPVFQPFVLPDKGLMSLRKLADYLNIEKVRDLVAVLPDTAVIIKLGTLKTSLIDLRELQKCLITVGSTRPQPPQPVQPQQVVQQTTPQPVQHQE